MGPSNKTARRGKAVVLRSRQVSQSSRLFLATEQILLCKAFRNVGMLFEIFFTNLSLLQIQAHALEYLKCNCYVTVA